MTASTLINPMLPILRPSHTVGEALDWMAESHLPQLAVVEGNEYKGVISEDVLMDNPLTEQHLSEIPLLHQDTYGTEDQHVFELIRIASRFGLKVIPVLQEGGVFKGCISVYELLEHFAASLGAQEKGAILVLKIDQRDYSLAEISRLIESDGVKIISSYYTTGYDFNTQETSFLTLKLNRVEITPIVASLERFGYIILEAHANAPIDSIDQERLDMLLRYLAT